MAESIAAAIGVSVETVQVGAIVAATAGSMAMSISQGNQSAAIAKANARNQQEQIKLQKAALEAESAEKALDNATTLRKTLAQNAAYYAASGADISSGTAAAVQEKNMQEANRQLRLNRLQTQLGLQSYDLQSDSLANSSSAQASSYITGGYYSAAGSLLSTGVRITDRE